MRSDEVIFTLKMFAYKYQKICQISQSQLGSNQVKSSSSSSSSSGLQFREHSPVILTTEITGKCSLDFGPDFLQKY